MFSLIPQDKANHEVYGSRIAAVFAVLVGLLMHANEFMGGVLTQFQGIQGLVMAASAACSALGAGVVKEFLDRKENEKAKLDGLPLPHTAERADIVATLKGGLMVAIPLAALGALQ